MIKRALVHVENTENLIDFMKYLDSEDWSILSADKTEDLLRKNKIRVTHEPLIAESNQFVNETSQLLKEINNTIIEEPDELLKQQNANSGISLICLNTYTTYRLDTTEAILKNIAKPQNFYISTIVRNAFSNYENVLILTDPQDYKEAIIQLKTDNITSEFRIYLAAKALNYISAFDAGIAASILKSPGINLDYMNNFVIPFKKESELRCGSNQQQTACFYGFPTEIGAVSGLTKLSSRDLSYQIVSDASDAWELISTLYTNLKSQYVVKSINADGYEFTTHFTPLTGTVFTVAIKFGLILGAALSTNVLDSFRNTCTYNRQEVTDVILGCSAVIDESAASEIIHGNFCAIIAPGFTAEAKDIFEQNKKIRLIPTSKINVTAHFGRFINGGIIVQTKDNSLFNRWQVKTKHRPSQQITDEMAFGMLLTLGTHSYSAVLIKENHLVGISQGCYSSEQAIRCAITEANITNSAQNSIADILVCDAPISFSESVKTLIDSGLSGIIQPGGTSTDNELVQYCDEKGISMVYTNMTHYIY